MKEQTSGSRKHSHRDKKAKFSTTEQIALSSPGQQVSRQLELQTPRAQTPRAPPPSSNVQQASWNHADSDFSEEDADQNAILKEAIEKCTNCKTQELTNREISSLFLAPSDPAVESSVNILVLDRFKKTLSFFY